MRVKSQADFKTQHRLLKALSDRRVERNEEEDYVLDQVLIPLLDAFAKARDLVGFIGHWREQLSTLEQKSDKDDFWTILDSLWKEEALSQAVSAQVESLTLPQISALINASLTNGDKSSRLSSRAISLQGVVVLESAINGLTREGNIDNLAQEAHSAYGMLLDNLTNNEAPSIPYRWRLWRTASSIARRWPIVTKEAQNRDLTITAICHALIILESVPRWRPDTGAKAADFTEHYHAFQFMLNFASQRQYLGDKEEDFSSRQKAEEAVGRLINIIQPLSQRVDNDIWGTFALQEENFIPFDSVSAVASVDAFYLGCIQSLLTSPQSLGYANIPATR